MVLPRRKVPPQQKAHLWLKAPLQRRARRQRRGPLLLLQPKGLLPHLPRKGPQQPLQKELPQKGLQLRIQKHHQRRAQRPLQTHHQQKELRLTHRRPRLQKLPQKLPRRPRSRRHQHPSKHPPRATHLPDYDIIQSRFIDKRIYYKIGSFVQITIDICKYILYH